MRSLLVASLLLCLVAPAAAQISVQEYPLPPRLRVHDVWADPAPDGPVWFSAGPAAASAKEMLDAFK